MRARSFLIRRMGFLTLLLGFLLFNFPLNAQSSDQNDAGPLIGTWVDNSNLTSGLYKWTINADGKAVNFFKGSDAPFEEAGYSIERRWTDDDANTWFQCQFFVHKSQDPNIGKVKWYVVFKIDASGTAMEAAWSQTGYKLDFHNSLHVLSHRE